MRGARESWMSALGPAPTGPCGLGNTDNHQLRTRPASTPTLRCATVRKHLLREGRCGPGLHRRPAPGFREELMIEDLTSGLGSSGEHAGGQHVERPGVAARMSDEGALMAGGQEGE